jgi:DNA-binding transcriptional ArsR family regulator
MKQILWYLLNGTRGGFTRAQLIDAIRKKPQNANQLAKTLNLDYKTIQHHLRVLTQHRMFTIINKGNYGAMYFIGPELEQHMQLFDDIWASFGNTDKKNKKV